MTKEIPQTVPVETYRGAREDIEQAVLRVLRSGRYILGEEVQRFEEAFADFVGVDHAVGVANGTEALQLALEASDIGPGDEVITVAHTAVATATAIARTGARPVLVDIQPSTYTIEPEEVSKAITPDTAAVVPVHLYGQAADMGPLQDLAEDHEIDLIEDCAQAHGATWKGEVTGSIGDLGAFSFYPTKNLPAFGDGGIVTTDDPDRAARLRALREYGWVEDRTSREVGLNSRLDELQAAALRVLLSTLPEANERRGAIAERYRSGIQNPHLSLPKERSDRVHVYHQFVVETSDRSGFRDHLRNHGVGTGVHYPRAVHQEPAFRDLARTGIGGLEQTERIVDEITSLPMHPGLSDESVNRVIEVVNGCSPTDPSVSL